MLNNSMYESPGGDDGASQTSQRSGTSLLERIRAQRNAEQQQRQYTELPNNFQVPRYDPNTPSSDFGGIDNSDSFGDMNRGRNFFSNAWSNISRSMESGMHSLNSQDIEATDALLPPNTTDEDYTMGGYARMFIADVHSGFTVLPFPLRIIVCVLLVYIAFKLL